VRGITSLCKKFNVPVHGDVTQMVGKYEINLRRDGLFSAAFSGHKFHGIRGCGGLFLRDPSRIDTCMTGGSQENNVRASTECTALICSMAYALHLALEDLPQKQQRVRRMRDYIQSEIIAMFPPGLVVVNCDTEDATKRLYNTLSISIPCCKNTRVMDELNKRGIYLNIGSACNKDKQSRNLSAIGLSEQHIQGTFRISLSSMNTIEECQYFVSAMHDMRPWFTLQQRKPRSDSSSPIKSAAAA
jgi:cysteine desulfurase